MPRPSKVPFTSVVRDIPPRPLESKMGMKKKEEEEKKRKTEKGVYSDL